MKLLSEKVLLSLLVIISIGGYVASCTHENQYCHLLQQARRISIVVMAFFCLVT